MEQEYLDTLIFENSILKNKGTGSFIVQDNRAIWMFNDAHMKKRIKTLRYQSLDQPSHPRMCMDLLKTKNHAAFKSYKEPKISILKPGFPPNQSMLMSRNRIMKDITFGTNNPDRNLSCPSNLQPKIYNQRKMCSSEILQKINV